MAVPVAAGALLAGEFQAKPIAEVTLRGKTKSLPIYEVVSSVSTVRV